MRSSCGLHRTARCLCLATNFEVTVQDRRAVRMQVAHSSCDIERDSQTPTPAECRRVIMDDVEQRSPRHELREDAQVRVLERYAHEERETGVSQSVHDVRLLRELLDDLHRHFARVHLLHCNGRAAPVGAKHLALTALAQKLRRESNKRQNQEW